GLSAAFTAYIGGLRLWHSPSWDCFWRSSARARSFSDCCLPFCSSILPSPIFSMWHASPPIFRLWKGSCQPPVASRQLKTRSRLLISKGKFDLQVPGFKLATDHRQPATAFLFSRHSLVFLLR